MGFRFRRRINLLPGVRLNLSKSGVSASVGRRGLWFTLGHGKARETVGLPGTGLSYTQEQRIGASPGERGRPAEPPASIAASDVEPVPASGGSHALIWLVLLVLVVVAIAAAIWR